MIVETMFNPGDLVWCLYDNKAKQVEIDSIILYYRKNSLGIQCFVNVGTEKDYKCHIIDEKNCFQTREELINSL